MLAIDKRNELYENKEHEAREYVLGQVRGLLRVGTLFSQNQKRQARSNGFKNFVYQEYEASIQVPDNVEVL